MLPDITAQQEVESSFKAAELTDIADKRASEALKYKDMINEQWMKSREATQVFFSDQTSAQIKARWSHAGNYLQFHMQFL